MNRSDGAVTQAPQHRCTGNIARRFRAITRGLRKTPLERSYADLELDELQDQIDKALKSGSVATTLLLTVATLRLPEFRVDKSRRALGNKYYLPLLDKWKSKHKNHAISVSPPHAVTVLHRATPRLNVQMSPPAAPDFDWSKARLLLNRADAVADRADTFIQGYDAKIAHMERAYAAATQIFATVQRERFRRERMGLGPTDGPTPAFVTELSTVEPQVETAEELLEQGARHDAQNTYLGGMLEGAVYVALFSLFGGTLLWLFKEPAVVGICFTAGALGAVISVLQRLTSGRFDLDFREPPKRVRFSGQARPWVGGVLSMVVFAILKSGLLGIEVDAPVATGPELAYYGALGFIAGFNERFAQDVVSRPMHWFGGGGAARTSAT